MIVQTELDKIQSRLHDDGTLWPRSELLDWYTDGYRQLLAQSHAVVRPVQIDVPGRAAWVGTFEWEDRHGQGTFRRYTRPIQSGLTQATHLWETESQGGVTVSASSAAVVHLWERAYSGDIDQHFRFALTKSHQRPLRVYWDHKRLVGASSRELDLQQTKWWREGGEPQFWLQGQGRERSFEVFEVVTSYNQQFALTDPPDTDGPKGISRNFAGSRTYAVDSQVDRWDYSYSGGGDGDILAGLGLRITSQADRSNDLDQPFYMHAWEGGHLVDSTDDSSDSDTDTATVFTHWWEAEYDTSITQLFVGAGLVRGISSSNRQYVPTAYDSGSQLLGCARDFKSGNNSITLFEVIVPTRALTESDIPSLIPTFLLKYVRFHVLGRAFGRVGEGFRPDLAQHYNSLAQLGVQLFTNLGNPTLIDRVYARDTFTPQRERTVPRTQLPSTYPRT